MAPAWRLIREARLEAGLTQQRLAARLGISQAAVAQLERPGSNPTIATLDGALRAADRRLELQSKPHRPSVDETLLARNLRMTPAERLSAFETAHRELEELRPPRGAARAS
jgi:transcriptional regulator with XRE-family HTH domain